MRMNDVCEWLVKKIENRDCSESVFRKWKCGQLKPIAQSLLPPFTPLTPAGGCIPVLYLSTVLPIL